MINDAHASNAVRAGLANVSSCNRGEGLEPLSKQTRTFQGNQ